MGVNSAATAAVSDASVSSSYSNPIVNSVNDNINRILDVSSANNAWSAQQAEIQRKWQEEQNKIAMDFNAAEAAKSRDWQAYMSNSAHQREVADLKAAGLNPILSATGGNGAAVTSGATASGVTSAGSKGDTDTSANAAIVSILSSALNAQTQLNMANTNAVTNLAVADKYNSMSKYVADLQSETSIQNSMISAAAQKFSAIAHADATKVAATISAEAQKYHIDVLTASQKEIAILNNEVNKELKQMGIDHEIDMAKYFPQTLMGGVASLSALLEDNVLSPISSALGNLSDSLDANGSKMAEHTWKTDTGKD